MIEHLPEETLAMHCMRVLLLGSKAKPLLAGALLVVSPLLQVLVEKTTKPQIRQCYFETFQCPFISQILTSCLMENPERTSRALPGD